MVVAPNKGCKITPFATQIYRLSLTHGKRMKQKPGRMSQRRHEASERAFCEDNRPTPAMENKL